MRTPEEIILKDGDKLIIDLIRLAVREAVEECCKVVASRTSSDDGEYRQAAFAEAEGAIRTHFKDYLT